MGVEVKHSFVTIHGLRIFYEECGRGIPLLLIHGLGGPLMWMKIIPLLAEKFRVISLELPGFGKSDCPQVKFTTTDYVNVVGDFMQQLHIEGCAVVSISYGGQIAATVASLSPSLVSKLVLICSTGLPPPAWQTKSMTLWKFYVQFLSATLLRSKTLVCLFSRLSYYDIRNRPPQLCEQYFEWFKRANVRQVWIQCVYNIMMPDASFANNLRTLSQPSLILWGRNDRTVLPDYAYAFLHLIHRSKLKMFARCAHSVPLERPHDVVNEITEFLNSSDERSVQLPERIRYAKKAIDH